MVNPPVLRNLWYAAVLLVLVCATVVPAADWVQFQNSKERLGRKTDQVLPEYRGRWFWLKTRLWRNTLSVSTWTGPGCYSIPLRTPLSDVAGSLGFSVAFTFMDGVQPVVVDGRVYIGDMDGFAYCIKSDDGTTLWTSSNPGGTLCSAAYVGGVVVFVSATGFIRGYDARTGALLWEVETDGAITSDPLTDGVRVYVGSQDGRV